MEFRHLYEMISKEDPEMGPKTLGYPEFKTALIQRKPDIVKFFTEKDFTRILSHIDATNSLQISLFEFVEVMKVSCNFL